MSAACQQLNTRRATCHTFDDAAHRQCIQRRQVARVDAASTYGPVQQGYTAKGFCWWSWKGSSFKGRADTVAASVGAAKDISVKQVLVHKGRREAPRCHSVRYEVHQRHTTRMAQYDATWPLHALLTPGQHHATAHCASGPELLQQLTSTLFSYKRSSQKWRRQPFLDGGRPTATLGRTPPHGLLAHHANSPEMPNSPDMPNSPEMPAHRATCHRTLDDAVHRQHIQRQVARVDAASMYGPGHTAKGFRWWWWRCSSSRLLTCKLKFFTGKKAGAREGLIP